MGLPAGRLMDAGSVLLACCAALYLALAAVIVWRMRRVTPALMAGCCLVTAGWAVAGLLVPGQAGVTGGADLLRALSWFGLLFFLYHASRLGSPTHEFGFALAAGVSTALCVLAMLAGPQSALIVFGMPIGIVGRLLLAVSELLLIENLYLNLPQHARWHVALPSVLLGGLACFDILLCAEVVIFHQSTAGLVGARTLGMIIIAPLLAVAASRGKRGAGRVRLSRAAAFHSATLMMSGSVLLALGLAGEVFRHFSGDWGWLAQVSLTFAATIGLGLLLTSGSARSRFQRLFIDHFFAERYDYRRQWQACIRTLSGEEGDLYQERDGGAWPGAAMQRGLAARAIRALVSVVDSPAGVLYLRDAGRGGSGAFLWAGSWNMPATEAVPEGHPAVRAMEGGGWIARLDGPERALAAAPLEGLGPLWLAVPLVHRGVMMGFVLSGAPRAPFGLEQEVFDLLRIVAQEVATYLAEQRATQTLLQTRQMHDYSKRFAFVAHDIKNVSSQLALLVSNAESHLSNPEFQQDMLETVRSSVRKITALLQRLERPEADAPGSMQPLPRLEALVATYQRVRQAPVALEHDGSTGSVAMGADAFETAVTHLLNNAVEAGAVEAGAVKAGARAAPVTVRVRHEARQVVVEIADTGAGMTAEFVQGELFRPFSTSKAGGSGIGAYQARELAREAGGDLLVTSTPGLGTTMRLLLPRTDSLATQNLLQSPGAPIRAEA